MLIVSIIKPNIRTNTTVANEPKKLCNDNLVALLLSFLIV